MRAGEKCLQSLCRVNWRIWGGAQLVSAHSLRRRPRYKRGMAVHGSSRSSSALRKKEGPVVAHDFNLSTWDAEVGGTL